MVHNWRLLAALLSLPILSLSAEEVATESDNQEIAIEETAASRFGPFDSGCPPRRKKQEVPLPGEAAIKSRSVITPSVAPQTVNGIDAIISADFIYWRTFIDAMEYAYGSVSDDDFAVPPRSNVKRGSTAYPDFKFQPGTKVGLGFHFPHDGWDIIAEWTYLSSKNVRSSTSTTPDSAVGLISVQQLISSTGEKSVLSLISASSKWKQDFNVIDLELGRDFFLSRYLTLRPSVGLKTAWIHETTVNKFTPVLPVVAFGSPAVVAIEFATLTNSQHVWGIGPRFTLDTGWHITKNWQFYGDFAFSNLWGQVSKSSKEVNNEILVSPAASSSSSSSSSSTSASASAGPSPPPGAVETLATADTAPSRGGSGSPSSSGPAFTAVPIIETSIGLSYINWFSKYNYRFEGRLGWEEQVWIDYNRSQDFIRVGNLTVQGVTLKLMLNY